MVVGVDIPTGYELRPSPSVPQMSNAGGWESDTYLEKFIVSKFLASVVTQGHIRSEFC